MQNQMQDGGERINYAGGAMREPATNKGAYELVSPFAWERIAIWYELGARKYADRNWEKGIPFGRLVQSALRHLIRWMKGDRSEDHLAAVCWNVMAMMHFEETGQADEWNNYPAYKRAEPCTEAPETHDPSPTPSAPVTVIREYKVDGVTVQRLEENTDPFYRPYKIIAVDFDGCLCQAAWPEIGLPNKHMIDKLILQRMLGNKVILWTCREGEMKDKAVEWCRHYGLEFDAVNANLPEMNAMYGNDSRKIGADEYWDDKAVNVKA